MELLPTNLSRFVQSDASGLRSLYVLVDGLHCPSCVWLIESALMKQEGVEQARLNLSTRRLKISWHGAIEKASEWLGLLKKMGYHAQPYDPASLHTLDQKEQKFLLRCLAVAGFASGNLMMFSVPLWAATRGEMGDATRTMLQWVCALIALPAICYAGLPFYRSAWKAVKEWRSNMDVPISVAIILATLMSVFETLTHGEHAYFDSAVMLLFFLLIGRYLDTRARGKARSAASDLLQMMAGSATVLRDGYAEVLPLSELQPEMIILVAAGEKISADGEVIHGSSEVDTSLITGETMPHAVRVGSMVYAGTVNMQTPLRVRVTGAGEQSLLAEIVRLMEHAEQAQAKYVSLADKVSRLYTPVVHVLAVTTFALWYWGLHASWQEALLISATVLIITCPCALGLAVPVVQVLASGRLLRQGILMKSGTALERLATIDTVMFDKTGTLTLGKPQLILPHGLSESQHQLAASLARHSKHPLSKTLAQSYSDVLLEIEVQEVPGCGLQALWHGKQIKLGKRSWCVRDMPVATDHALELWLAIEGSEPLRLTFEDAMRSDAEEQIKCLKHAGIHVGLISGDREATVKAVADQLGIMDYASQLTPVEKCEQLKQLQQQGKCILMVGDGLNDAPSLAVAAVSMSPASAMDITQNVADIVFQGDKLSPVFEAWRVAKFSQVLVKQNFILSIGYNIFAIPLAVAGYVTPLIASIAMSSSSILVILNAMRLSRRNK